MKAAVEIFVVAGILAYTKAQNENDSQCTEKSSLACYTCMGKNLEDCYEGKACCKGSCFKLIDLKHQVIMKGCTTDNEEDASMKVRTLAVPLYWANNEPVTGESYFCKSKDYCNFASSSLSYPFILCSLLLGRFIV